MTTPHKEITTGLKFPEGPVAMPDGSVILVEIARETLTRVMPDGKQHVIAKHQGPDEAETVLKGHLHWSHIENPHRAPIGDGDLVAAREKPQRYRCPTRPGIRETTRPSRRRLLCRRSAIPPAFSCSEPLPAMPSSLSPQALLESMASGHQPQPTCRCRSCTPAPWW